MASAGGRIERRPLFLRGRSLARGVGSKDAERGGGRGGAEGGGGGVLGTRGRRWDG